MIDFEWYRSFIHIYKYNSVSEAAKARMMTQPAMSQHLAYLESEAGEALFIRTARKMIPTERGKALYSQLAPLIESLEEASLNIKSVSLPTLSILRIGSAIEYYTEHILPRLSDYNTSTVTHFGTADQLLELLKEDKVDIVFTSQKYQTPGIEYAKPLLKPAHVIPNLHLILKAIENGAGVSLIPTYILENVINKANVRVIFEDLSVKNELYIAYKTKHKHLPDIIRIRSTMLGRASNDQPNP